MASDSTIRTLKHSLPPTRHSRLAEEVRVLVDSCGWLLSITQKSKVCFKLMVHPSCAGLPFLCGVRESTTLPALTRPAQSKRLLYDSWGIRRNIENSAQKALIRSPHL